MKRDLLEALGSVVAAVLIYKFGLVAFFLFLVPLLVFRHRKGETWFIAVSGATLLVILVLGWFGIRGLVDAETLSVLLAMEILLPASLLAGAWFVYAGFGSGGWLSSSGKTVRIAMASGLVCAAGFVLIPWLSRSEGLVALFTEKITEMQSMLQGTSDEAFASEILRVTGVVMRRMFGALYLVFLSAGCYLGEAASARFLGAKKPVLVSYRLPDVVIWALIASLAGVLLTRFAEIGVAGDLVWNAALAALFLYGVQGAGVVEFALARVGKGLRLAIMVAGIVLILSGSGILVIMLGFPGLGIADHWIKFRERSYGNESNPE